MSVGKGYLILSLFVSNILFCIFLFGDWGTARLMFYRSVEVADVGRLYLSPFDANSLRYHYDDIDALEKYLFEFKKNSLLIEKTSTLRDLEKVQYVMDRLYALRRTNNGLAIPGTKPFSYAVEAIKNGEIALCNLQSAVTVAVLGTMGYYARQVRWSTPKGMPIHTGFEVYAPDWQKWFYYDPTINNAIVDKNGIPLNAFEIRDLVLSGGDVSVFNNSAKGDQPPKVFVEQVVKVAPYPFIDLKNDFLYFEREQRFGPLNAFYPLLVSLPHPVDRMLDALLGFGDVMAAPSGGFPSGIPLPRPIREHGLSVVAINFAVWGIVYLFLWRKRI